jgi:WXG100 family type VII secretion target
MARMEISTDDMRRVASEIDGKIDEWRQSITDLNTLYRDMDNMWDGDANDSFNVIFQDDQAKFTQLTQVMQDYCTAITTAANNYDLSESNVKNIVTRR